MNNQDKSTPLDLFLAPLQGVHLYVGLLPQDRE